LDLEKNGPKRPADSNDSDSSGDLPNAQEQPVREGQAYQQAHPSQQDQYTQQSQQVQQSQQSQQARAQPAQPYPSYTQQPRQAYGAPNEPNGWSGQPGASVPNDPYSQQRYGFTPPPPYAPPKTNAKSVVALVLGIVSIVLPYLGLLIGILAIIFASLSFKEIKRTGEQGKGMAVAGLVCGIVGTAIYAIIILFVIIAVFAFSDVGTNNNYVTF